MFLAALWIAQTGISLLIARGRPHRYLIARLEAAFGRSVEAGSFSVNFFGVPELEAQSVTVGEDPRFGREYFLRAEKLEIRLRWAALLRGRLELGTLSFTQPSLNLVRAADGRWNIESWLPRPASGPAVGGSGRGAPKFARIEFDNGRINFKREEEKLPFALVGVTGTTEQANPGQWRIDAEAQPRRAATPLQQAGMLELHGQAGGIGSRLRPAELELDWSEASLPDVLRLARGTDSGVRGTFSLAMTAKASQMDWDFAGHAELRRMHRWDLPLRAEEPAVNVELAAAWRPENSRLELKSVTLETPRSNLRATGELGWTTKADYSMTPSRDMTLQIQSPGVQLEDLLVWLRAFYPGVAEELQARGEARVDFTLAGWPPKVERGTIAMSAANLEGGSLSESVRSEAATLRWNGKQIDVTPFHISIGSRDEMRMEFSAQERSQWTTSARISASIERVEGILEAAAALGRPLPAGWSVAGPVKAELKWQGQPWPAFSDALGKIETSGLTVHAPFLNQPVRGIKATADLRAEGKNIALGSAQAFGAKWSGTLRRGNNDDGWTFSLAADRLSGAEFDRWLNPQWRASLMQRLLPFLGGASPVRVPAGLVGTGKITVEKFEAGSLALGQLRGELSVDGRRLKLAGGEADFYGGKVRGEFAADLEAAPNYRGDLELDGVNLDALADATTSLRGKIGGNISGNLAIGAQGEGRTALGNSVSCKGRIEIRDAHVRGFDLIASLRAAATQSGTSTFGRAAAEFTCAGGKILVKNLRLAEDGIEIRGSGIVDFARNFDLRLTSAGAPIASKTPGPLTDAPAGVFHLGGSLDAPLLTGATGPK
ncbi:MAG: AsmA-like C-terminal region-containing protein [Candidatus Acidiferrales bacterium]